jgi:lipopolysaccharide transport system ATP-binding protein
MSSISIAVENVSKKYTIGRVRQRHDTLRDELVHGLKSAFRREDPSRREAERSVWAVKDVSFDVKPGEVLGVIGRNGAGKSTLLKILSRITEPTRGRCEIYGRLGSLLEVGTGFSGELTGRENVYLNGVILGMKKAEVERKFDEIVAFAEVEKFIDTPVKRYSSGMSVRLAFAVAAHLEPEILIVDEVLAVGDLNFQNKCIGKLGDVAREGRTVLFVSHNMGAVTNLCTTGMWIEHGMVKMRNDVKSVVGSYVKQQPDGTRGTAGNWKRVGTGDARIVSARVTDTLGNDCGAFLMGDTIGLEFDVEFHSRRPTVNFAIEIARKEMGMRVLHLQNDDCGFMIETVVPGVRRFRVEIPNCMLYPTSYDVMLCIWDRGETLDYVEGLVSFSMIQSDVTRRTAPLTIHREAIFYAPSIWRNVQADEVESAAQVMDQAR